MSDDAEEALVAEPHEIVIDVRATAVNRLDLMQRSGKMSPPPGASQILGLEVAGIVRQADENGLFAVGDEVIALVSGGGYATSCVADARHSIEKPKGLGWARAASIPEVWLTAYQLLFFVANLQRDQSVLIHAAASGVGCAAIQLAKDAGAKVVATASSQAKIDLAMSLGADGGVVVPRGGPSWLDRAVSLAGGSFDVVLDCVGSSYAADNLKALNVDGTWVLYSLLSGGSLDPDIPLLPGLMRKRASIRASSLRTRLPQYKAKLVQSLVAEGVFDKIENGSFKLIVDTVFSGLKSAQEAHTYMESNANMGKIVIELDEDDLSRQRRPPSDEL